MSQKQKTIKNPPKAKEDELLSLEAKYCSWGDTVHYAEKLNIFDRAEGICLYDREGTEFVDLQMWYSAANFGYRNQRLNDALKRQIDKLPQLACQYLHAEKILLATKLAQRIGMIFEQKGRVHFNVGGSAAIEDSLKLVRNHTGRNSQPDLGVETNVDPAGIGGMNENTMASRFISMPANRP